MIKVLFICHGNICRSPMAEFVLKDLTTKYNLDSVFHIESAATSYEEIGNPVYPPARRELARHGISCEGKRARKLVKRDFEDFDYLIAMEEYNLRNIRREFASELAGRVTLLLDYTSMPRDIDDPWYTGNFETTYCEIKEGCTGFLKYLNMIP
uniref:low molecular weight protein-tyrosine-phosphatase n=1 Tax=Agathobacter sp. TaxID=2021311 RepID=UPI0040561B87